MTQILLRLAALTLVALPNGAIIDGQQRNRQTALPAIEDGTSVIAGRVVDSQTKQPVPGAEITITLLVKGGSSRGGVLTTDADGRYSFPEIGEGTYLIMAVKPEYLNSCYVSPESTSPCATVAVLRDQKRLDVNIELIKGAIARGRVVDDGGAPIGDAIVRMGSPRQPGNEMARAILFSNATDASDADGTFELRGIPPGEWNLELELTAPSGSIRPPLFFYPGVIRSDDARRVEFSSGRVTDNLQFTVPRIGEHALTVRVSPGPLPIGDIRTSFMQTVPFVSRTITLNDEGIGQVKGLLEGRYFIAARGWIDDKAWSAFHVVDFIPPVADVSLQLTPAGTISGRLVARNGGLPPLSGVVVATPWMYDDVEINPVAPDESPVAADGTFHVEGVFGQRAVKVIGLDADWQVVSTVLGRSDVTSVDVPPAATVELTIVVARR
jgi:hypothetical protein